PPPTWDLAALRGPAPAGLPHPWMVHLERGQASSCASPRTPLAFSWQKRLPGQDGKTIANGSSGGGRNAAKCWACGLGLGPVMEKLKKFRPACRWDA
ncbi:hypothetical protein L0F63_002505, partial [Massospora cicadina]